MKDKDLKDIEHLAEKFITQSFGLHASVVGIEETCEILALLLINTCPERSIEGMEYQNSIGKLQISFFE